uniref:Mitotic arrest deficient 1 like 1 n=1 Tax=Oryctolagus cuniculus TaxID=9986 RepID=A0A5F9CC58_RABIT
PLGLSPTLACSPSAQREVDRNQELLTRIRQLQEREAAAEGKVQEQRERHRLCQQSLDATSQRLREKEDGLAAAGETINALKGRVSELQWSLTDQERQLKRLESEKQELGEQLELRHRQWQEANQKIQELQASQEVKADQEQKIKDLEQKLSLQEQDAVVVRSMKSELARLPKMERELKRLQDENSHLREMSETNGVLQEELEGLQRRLARQEQVQQAVVGPGRLLAKLQGWERLDAATGLNLRTPEDLSRFVVELQQRELALKDKNSSISSSARALEKAQQQLQEEVRQVSGQLLEERKKREAHEALARRLQKRVLLLTKVQVHGFLATKRAGIQGTPRDFRRSLVKVSCLSVRKALSSWPPVGLLGHGWGQLSRLWTLTLRFWPCSRNVWATQPWPLLLGQRRHRLWGPGWGTHGSEILRALPIPACAPHALV